MKAENLKLKMSCFQLNIFEKLGVLRSDSYNENRLYVINT